MRQLPPSFFLCTPQAGGQREQQAPTQHTLDSSTQLGNESGCKMGGQWENGCYEKLVAAIPTASGKAGYLARVVDALQLDVFELQVKAKLSSNHLDRQDKTLNDLANQLNSQSGFPAANFLAIQDMQRNLDDLKRQLIEFKDGACPVLKTAKMSWETKLKIDSACGLR